MNEIKRVQIENQYNNGKVLEVGKTINGKVIKKIEVFCSETSTLYLAEDARGNSIRGFENCPVSIEYF
jgi:hypothetical protein